jgi:hypothetical protein
MPVLAAISLCVTGCILSSSFVLAENVSQESSIVGAEISNLPSKIGKAADTAKKRQGDANKSKAEPVVLPVPTGVTKAFRVGDEKRVDSWVDAWMSVQSGPAGQAVRGNYKPDHGLLDTTDAKSGYYSVRYKVVKPSIQGAFGFQAGPYIAGWELGRDFFVDFWIKAQSSMQNQNWILAIYDEAGNKASGALEGMAADDQWRKFSLPLKSLTAKEGFDFSKVVSVQVETELPKDARVWLDDVVFQNGPETLGVSDKTVTQYMAEAEASRPQRVHEVLATQNNSPSFQFIARLYNGTDLEKVNEEIIAWARKSRGESGVEQGEQGETANASWSLWTNSMLNWMLFGFSSQGRIKPGRLTPECEEALLDYYWHHLKLKNDIATARQSSWWVTGSENHDINFKSANLLSSQIFKNRPDYAKKIYPNLGRMQGYGYGAGGTFRAGQGSPVLKLGSGQYKDGKEYNASDHYKAWVTFWKDFLAERARHGFFIEHNAPGYMSHTQRFLHDVYAWTEDEKLHEQARMFVDLVWAQWAQDQMLSINTGVGVRGCSGWTRMGRMSEFLLGGPGLGSFYAFSDYQLPRQVWEMLLDRPGMGEYAFISRKPNEAQDIWPQPPGTEYTILARPDSRLVRYTWVTPDYSMGTRMDHPDALYSHLSTARGGVNFPTDPNAMIHWGGNLLAVQDKGAALMQQKRTVRYQHPMWFPAYSPTPEPLQVILGSGLDRIEEKDGWVFVLAGNAYTALRIVTPAVATQQANALGKPLPVPVNFDKEGFGLFAMEPKGYTLVEGVPTFKGSTLRDGKTMTATELNSGLIVESSSKAHHQTFEEFKKDVLDNPIMLKQVLANGFILTYRGCGKDAKVLELNCSSNQTPKVGGEYVRYDSPTFDSPYLQGAAGGGIVTLAGPVSGKKSVLNFNEIQKIEQ